MPLFTFFYRLSLPFALSISLYLSLSFFMLFYFFVCFTTFRHLTIKRCCVSAIWDAQWAVMCTWEPMGTRGPERYEREVCMRENFRVFVDVQIVCVCALLFFVFCVYIAWYMYFRNVYLCACCVHVVQLKFARLCLCVTVRQDFNLWKYYCAPKRGPVRLQTNCASYP